MPLQKKKKKKSIRGRNNAAAARAIQAIKVIDDWLQERSDYDNKVWPELKAALEQNRLSERRLFHE